MVFNIKLRVSFVYESKNDIPSSTDNWVKDSLLVVVIVISTFDIDEKEESQSWS